MKNTIPQLDRCIACTTCTVVCPVAQATPAYLGPRMTGPAYERFRFIGLGEDSSLPYCSNCKNCDIACPNSVPISTFIMRARAEVCKEKRPPLRDWFISHGADIGWLLTHVPAWLKNWGMNFFLTRQLLGVIGIATKAPLPPFAKKSFRRLFCSLQQPKGLSRKVVYFPGCFVDMYDPGCGIDFVSLMNRAGYEVLMPKNFVCCGLPMVANGFWEDAKKNAEKNLIELKKWKEKGIPVITGCTSCSLMFKDDYEHYFPELIPHETSPALADACEFVLECIQQKKLSIPHFSGAQQRILYHAPCHLRAQGIGTPGFELLTLLPGYTTLNAHAGCCGISGSYGFKSDKYDIAMKIGENLFTAMRTSGATICSSECGTCRVQMEHGGHKKTLHPLSILRHYLDVAAQ